jgi:undecaprenyl diphosphate synthase
MTTSISAPDTSRLPRHVAIVMDGNGRWAKRRLMPRGMGHKAGVDALVNVVKACSDRRIKYLTVFAFSSENWKRPAQEVSGLMSLLLKALSKHLTRLCADGVRVRVVGDLDVVADPIRKALLHAQSSTEDNEKLVLTVAFNYGGRWDIVQATRRLMASQVSAENIDELLLSENLAMSYAPDPDLLIRTGGEVRFSNFLLWQSAYTELYFTDCLWPDFDAQQLDIALRSYATRERRFGDVTDTRGDAVPNGSLK